MTKKRFQGNAFKSARCKVTPPPAVEDSSFRQFSRTRLKGKIELNINIKLDLVHTSIRQDVRFSLLARRKKKGYSRKIEFAK